MASLLEVVKEVEASGDSFYVVRHVVGQWSVEATVERPRALTDRSNIFEDTAYAPLEACRQASELLITSLARLEPPIIVTEEDIFLSVRADGSHDVSVTATLPLDKDHPLVAEANETSVPSIAI